MISVKWILVLRHYPPSPSPSPSPSLLPPHWDQVIGRSTATSVYSTLYSTVQLNTAVCCAVQVQYCCVLYNTAVYCTILLCAVRVQYCCVLYNTAECCTLYCCVLYTTVQYGTLLLCTVHCCTELILSYCVLDLLVNCNLVLLCSVYIVQYNAFFYIRVCFVVLYSTVHCSTEAAQNQLLGNKQ